MDEPKPPMFEEIRAKRQKPLYSIIGIVTAAATYAGMNMLSPELRVRIYAGAVVGLLLALIPFFIAKKRKVAKVGSIALLAGLLAGAAGGALLAAPLAIVMSIVASLRDPS